MEYVLAMGVVILVAVFEPGNRELNEHCRDAVSVGEHDSMIQCREYYRPKRR